MRFNYSQLPPCGHLAITDTPLLRTDTKSPAKVTKVWLKWTPAITESHYYGLTDTLFGPNVTILFSLSRYYGHRAASCNICTHVKSIFSAFVYFLYFCLFFLLSALSLFCSLAAMNKFVQSVMIQMVDRPNTTPIGQNKKTLTFKALLWLMSTFSKDHPFLYESIDLS